jgi:hypothetical protein
MHSLAKDMRLLDPDVQQVTPSVSVDRRIIVPIRHPYSFVTTFSNGKILASFCKGKMVLVCSTLAV